MFHQYEFAVPDQYGDGMLHGKGSGAWYADFEQRGDRVPSWYILKHRSKADLMLRQQVPVPITSLEAYINNMALLTYEHQ